MKIQELFKAGERVKHATKTEWGIGEVLANESGGRVKIFFEDVGAKEFDLEHARFIRVYGDEAESDYLTALVKHSQTEFAKPTTAGKKRLEFMPFSKAVDKFLSFFPAGFQDMGYLEGKRSEREYKVVANRLMLDLLSKDVFKGLLQQGNYKEVLVRVKSVMNKTNLIHHYEKIWLTNGTKTDALQKKFAESLFDLLYGDNETRNRFERFSEMLSGIGAAKWPIATYFLFITFPEVHMFLKPVVTQDVANVLSQEINYKPELNWLTYSQVLRLAERIRNELSKDGRQFLKPRDMIDVQSFIWIIAPGYF